MTAVTMQVEDRTEKVPPDRRPWPLVRLTRHPLRAAHNIIQTYVTSALGGHVFVLAWIGLYYLLFEVISPVKGFWDTALSVHFPVLSQDHWDTWRHLFRNGGEYYLAALAIQAFLYNPYKHSVKRVDSVGEAAGRFALALVCAIPVFIIGGILINDLQDWLHTGHLAPAIGHHPSLAAKLYADSWTSKAVAMLAGVVGARKPMLPVFDYLQRYFAERRVARGRRAHFYHPPAYRALVNEHRKDHGMRAQRKAAESQADRGAWSARILVGGAFLVLLLAGVGVYVLEHFAK